MQLTFRKAEIADAQLLVDIYNASFYADFVRYGECPGYGKTRQAMEDSIRRHPKQIALADGEPVGVISYEAQGGGAYEIGCLCVVPTWQGKGIGTRLFQHFLSLCTDWTRVTLITPADKEENRRFYTEKCGFRMNGTELDGCVEVVRFLMERE